ncbi:MAG: hypothetical protein SW833_26230 [Cyanobacteriota bacterium]|nr:hypothetical protein [Cyanobacteriota bacterium]
MMLDRSTNGKGYESRVQDIRQELLELIVQEDEVYPWNPADSETEAYFARLERELGVEESDVEAIYNQSESFLGQLHRCWSSEDRSVASVSLVERFGDCVPHDWLEAIALRARSLLSSSLSPTDQLVQCVKPLLENWAEADLYVFARPLAQAMRSGSSMETETAIPNWEQLSQVEQARYTMKIARIALVELEATDGN